jgi:hypothetical protein
MPEAYDTITPFAYRGDNVALLELERAALAPDVSDPSPPAGSGLVHVWPHTIGTERFPTVSSGASFAEVAAAILQ